MSADKNRLNRLTIVDREARTANMVLPQWGVKCFYETFVLKQTVVHLLNICANPPTAAIPKTLAEMFRNLSNDTNQL